jgi:hypothetical protein
MCETLGLADLDPALDEGRVAHDALACLGAKHWLKRAVACFEVGRTYPEERGTLRSLLRPRANGSREDSRVKAAAIRVLVRLEDRADETLDQISALLSDEGEPVSLRREAARALGVVGTGMYAQDLHDLAIGTSDAKLAISAAHALGAIARREDDPYPTHWYGKLMLAAREDHTSPLFEIACAEERRSFSPLSRRSRSLCTLGLVKKTVSLPEVPLYASGEVELLYEASKKVLRAVAQCAFPAILYVVTDGDTVAYPLDGHGCSPLADAQYERLKRLLEAGRVHIRSSGAAPPPEVTRSMDEGAAVGCCDHAQRELPRTNGCWVATRCSNRNQEQPQGISQIHEALKAVAA